MLAKSASVPIHSDDLFMQLLNQYSRGDIAHQLGLHPNTVQRWLDRNSASPQYRMDFARLLGVSVAAGGGRAVLYRPARGAILFG